MPNYGIENLKILIAFAVQSALRIINVDQNNNGKVSITEMLGIVTSVGLKFPKAYESFPAAKQEFKDLNADEISELVDFFQDEFDLPPDQDRIERIIELVLTALNQNYFVVRQIVAELQQDA